MDSPEIRQALEEIADQYELLAEDLEAAAKHSPPKKPRRSWAKVIYL
jgi:hypothetical protein